MCVPCLEQLLKTTSALEKKKKGKLICETVDIFADCGVFSEGLQ